MASAEVTGEENARRGSGHRARRRRGRAASPADAGPRQAGGLLRRPLPHHRLRPQQLHQLGPPARLHRHPVQVALAQPPHPHGLEHRLRGARRVHRDPAAAEARGRELVPGHRGRRLPEPLLDRAREPAARDRPRRRPRVQDGLRPDAALSPGARRGRDHRHDRDAGRGIAAVRHRAGGRSGSRHRVPGEAEERRSPIPGSPAPGPGLDGHLRLRGRRADAGARSGRRRATRRTTSARTSSRRSSRRRRSSPTASTTRTRRRRSTGATSARSTPTSTRTWTWCR